jgi:sigma-B regulation protein RsbU (phosphoserine phosphatase)
LAEAATAAIAGYIIAASLETLIIRWTRPSSWELAWISDVALAFAFGVAVYLWRRLLTTRHALAERDRAELVLQTQLALAADIQRRLLPAMPPPRDGLDCAALLQSAGKIGGDFYDFLEAEPGCWLVLVADVSGKGIPAAMALGLLRSTFRTLARQRLQPAQIVTRLSEAFLEEWRGSPYVTCIVVTVDLRTWTLTYTNAGHPPGMFLDSQGIRRLDRGGPPAGLLSQACFEQGQLPIHSGDACLLVTDGVTETVDSPAVIESAFTTSLSAGVSAAGVCEALMARALSGSGPAAAPDWDDDRTIMVLRLSGKRDEEIE